MAAGEERGLIIGRRSHRVAAVAFIAEIPAAVEQPGGAAKGAVVAGIFLFSIGPVAEKILQVVKANTYAGKLPEGLDHFADVFGCSHGVTSLLL